jgi:hypothetical protein
MQTGRYTINPDATGEFRRILELDLWAAFQVCLKVLHHEDHHMAPLLSFRSRANASARVLRSTSHLTYWPAKKCCSNVDGELLLLLYSSNKCEAEQTLIHDNALVGVVSVSLDDSSLRVAEQVRNRADYSRLP